MILIIYPEKRLIPDSTVIQWAKDELANQYLKANPGVDPYSGAVEANSKVDSLEEAMEILSDSGTVTFGKN